jgi:hypothetical protein
MTYTKENNVLMATLAFMNEANYQNMIAGNSSIFPGVTGQLFKEKQRKAKLGIPNPTKLSAKIPSGLEPEVGMRYPEKRTGKRKAKALEQLNSQKDS